MVTTCQRRLRLIGGVLLTLAALLGGCSESNDVSTPSRPSVETSEGQGLIAGIDALAARSVADGLPGLSVAVARPGEMLLAKGYGYADINGRVLAGPATVYRIGSLTKQFTAAAVMDLAEQGLLSIDDEVTRFLPDFPTDGHRLTVRHLLSHTSGLRNYTEGPGWEVVENSEVPREEIVKLFARPLRFPPGTQWEYSNSNYYLLGLVIEKTSGRTYASYLDERFFGPLNMDSTSYCPDEPMGPEQAKGYRRGAGDEPIPSVPLNLDHPFAAGGLCSTVEDLVRWNDALHGRHLLTDESYRLMTTPTGLADGTTSPYGFGLGLEDRPGRQAIFHDGAINGFVSCLWYLPEQRLTVAAVANNGPPSGARFCGGLARLLTPERLAGL